MSDYLPVSELSVQLFSPVHRFPGLRPHFAYYCDLPDAWESREHGRDQVGELNIEHVALLPYRRSWEDADCGEEGHCRAARGARP
jgi:hypothetical protein